MSARLGFGQRLKARQNLVADEPRQSINEAVKVDYGVPSLESYAGGPFELHIHLSWHLRDSCAVWECADSRGTDRCRPHDLSVDGGLVVGDAGEGYDEFSVLVGILERFEQREGMVLGSLTAKHARMVRLQHLQECDAVSWQALRDGSPLPSFISMQVVPARWVDSERILGADGKFDLTPVLTWCDGHDKMIERGSHVEQIVPEDNGEVSRWRDAAEIKAIAPDKTLALGLHRLDHRVFVATPEVRGERMKVFEVLVGPLELQTMRWGRHRLPLEDHAEGQDQAADADDAQGPHDPGAES